MIHGTNDQFLFTPNVILLQSLLFITLSMASSRYKTIIIEDGGSLLQEKEVGPEDCHYSFPPAVLAYLRALLPHDVLGEFRDSAYQVTMEEFCQVFCIRK